MLENQTLGKKIKYFRKQNGLTQRQLADRLFLTDKAVSKWENDASVPDIYTLRELCGIFGCELQDFISAEVQAKSESISTGTITVNRSHRPLVAVLCVAVLIVAVLVGVFFNYESQGGNNGVVLAVSSLNATVRPQIKCGAYAVYDFAAKGFHSEDDFTDKMAEMQIYLCNNTCKNYYVARQGAMIRIEIEGASVTDAIFTSLADNLAMQTLTVFSVDVSGIVEE